jgi:CTP:molybdopterin cytidylyltransferase MocA
MITGLVLAAGAGRRFGRPKADILVGGERLIDSAVSVLLAGGCDEVLAVVRSELVVPNARTVVNPAPDEGMGSSLRVGLAAIDAHACVIVLVDQVGITADDVSAVIAEHRCGAPLVVARRAGHRSHPVLVARALFSDFASASVGDQGGRGFIDGRPEAVAFVDLADEVVDVDTPDDLAGLS